MGIADPRVDPSLVPPGSRAVVIAEHQAGDDMKDDRSVCTKEAPMPKGDKGRWQHPDAKDVGEEYNGLSGGGDYDIYLCPNCGLRFYVELPD